MFSSPQQQGYYIGYSKKGHTQLDVETMDEVLGAQVTLFWVAVVPDFMFMDEKV